MKKFKVIALVLAVMAVFTMVVSAQLEPNRDTSGTAPAAAAPAGGHGGGHGGGSPSFITIVMAGGPVGISIWLLIFADYAALIYFIVELSILLRQSRIIPPVLVSDIQQAMQEGDILKALKHCEDNPGPLANILTAGFSNVEEGFETIQEMISAAADLENEKLLQRVVYMNVVSNLGPLLGLLGTVHGMIGAFSSLSSTSAGAAQQAQLALNISESLYCTCGGLLVAIPALAGFYMFKNQATKMILTMQALTIDMIKSLRNVEVVQE